MGKLQDAAQVKICEVVLRHSSFSPDTANSIELNAHEFAVYSRYKENICILGPENTSPFPDLTYVGVPGYAERAWWRSIPALAQQIRHLKPALVEIQQFEPLAFALALVLREIPVVLHRHNFTKKKKNVIWRAMRRRRYSALSAMTFCSDATRSDFEAYYDPPPCKTVTIPNAIDTEIYLPQKSQRRQILFVGRLSPEKGALPTAQALLQVLPSNENWRAVFVLTGTNDFPDYSAEFKSVIRKLGSQVEMYEQIPFDKVMELNQTAEIAIVPSICDEAFGRVALEAIASGAALVSSGTGGLEEISGEHALYLPEVSSNAIALAVNELINNEKKRIHLQLAARERAEDLYDVKKVVAKLDTLRRAYLSAANRE